MKTFTFSARSGKPFRFLPGQFLTFNFTIAGEALSRCYTIASPPTRPDRISITVKRTSDGNASNWLHQSLQVGMEVQADGPFGSFSSFAEPPQKYLFLTAGSGITPLMSMARAYADLAFPTDMVFVHHAQTPHDIIFCDELVALSARNADFKLVLSCETMQGGDVWFGYTGRISLPFLHLAVPDFLSRSVYTCGPAAYMTAVRDILTATGYSLESYHEESFAFDTSSTETEPALVNKDDYTVIFKKTSTTVICNSSQTILDAARKAGLKLPASCTRGLCGTCKTTLVAGEVDMQHSGGIRQREIDRGQILLCCSKPLSDLVIDS